MSSLSPRASTACRRILTTLLMLALVNSGSTANSMRSDGIAFAHSSGRALAANFLRSARSIPSSPALRPLMRSSLRSLPPSRDADRLSCSFWSGSRATALFSTPWRRCIAASRQGTRREAGGCSDAEGASEFVLQLDEHCRVRVIRELFPEAQAAQLLEAVPGAVEGQLVAIGSRLSTVFFDEPSRDYVFSGRTWSAAGNCAMPPDIARVQAAASAAAGEEFNGAVVNVYGTRGAQIKWHDDGEYGVGPTVASFSLGRAAVMGFRRKKGKRRSGQWGQSIPPRAGGGADAAPLARAQPEAHRSDSTEEAQAAEAGEGVPVVVGAADSSGVVRVEVRHNTLVVMEAGVQDAWEHRIFKPLPPAPGPRSTPPATPHWQQAPAAVAGGGRGKAGAEGQGAAAEEAIEPRINLTFHVHD